MLGKIVMAATCALLLAPVAAHAKIVTGSFAGTMTLGTDQTGVFGTLNADWATTTPAITGSFSYDTALFSQVQDDTTNNATATGFGALTVTLTMGDYSHTFTDETSASIYLDTGASEVLIQNADSSGDASVSENFYLDASDFITPFVGSTDLNQSFSASPMGSLGTFSILDLGPDATASGSFTVSSLTLTPTDVPEPTSIALLLVGVAGIAVGRIRTKCPAGGSVANSIRHGLGV